MTERLGAGRHLSTVALFEHWAHGVPVLLPLDGVPALRLLIDGGSGRLALRVPVGPGVEAPSNDLANVSVEIVSREGARTLEVSTLGEGLLSDGYAMLSAVADRVQLDGLDPVVALVETLDRWRAVIALRSRISLEREVGLYGELLTLEAFLPQGASAALGAWRGPSAEEHDFGLTSADVEVKTTSTERRDHWIGGLEQLTESPGRMLVLLSLQITRAGGGPGRSLPQLIDDVAENLTGVERIAFAERVAAAGWRESERQLVGERWRLRSSPRAFIVRGDFPRVTLSALEAGGVALDSIREVRYRIDLTNREPSPGAPEQVMLMLQEMENRDG